MATGFLVKEPLPQAPKIVNGREVLAHRYGLPNASFPLLLERSVLGETNRSHSGRKQSVVLQPSHKNIAPQCSRYHVWNMTTTVSICYFRSNEFLLPSFPEIHLNIKEIRPRSRNDDCNAVMRGYHNEAIVAVSRRMSPTALNKYFAYFTAEKTTHGPFISLCACSTRHGQMASDVFTRSCF